MYLKFIIYIIIILISVSAPRSVFSEGAKEQTSVRPNVSGGYEFYSPTGEKTGFSSSSGGGGYEYYDKYGNPTGFLKSDTKTGKYEFYDADGIKRGELAANPYGGYRYSEQKEAAITAAQMSIRRDYAYADPYGTGIETLSSDTIRGLAPGLQEAEKAGLVSVATTEVEGAISTKTGLETSGSEQKGKGLDFSIGDDQQGLAFNASGSNYGKGEIDKYTAK